MSGQRSRTLDGNLRLSTLYSDWIGPFINLFLRIRIASFLCYMDAMKKCEPYGPDHNQRKTKD